MTPTGMWWIICKALWTLLRGSFIRSILSVFPSDLPGVNPATLNGMLLYYRLMTKWSGLGDSTELSRVGLSQGPRLVFFKWSCSLPLFGFRLLVGVSFCSFLFFSFLFFSLLLLYVGVVNALIKGETEDHVWFEDRWMVASLCDEWLTTLCGLILG
jgi:hypothetical protein